MSNRVDAVDVKERALLDFFNKEYPLVDWNVRLHFTVLDVTATNKKGLKKFVFSVDKDAELDITSAKELRTYIDRFTPYSQWERDEL